MASHHLPRAAHLDGAAAHAAGRPAVRRAPDRREPRAAGQEFLFLDEAPFIRDWGTWVKHQVDFRKDRRIAFTGSATPLVEEGQESGVGRWHTIRLTTLSFYEYLQIKQLALPSLPRLRSLRDLFDWTPGEFYKTNRGRDRPRRDAQGQGHRRGPGRPGCGHRDRRLQAPVRPLLRAEPALLVLRGKKDHEVDLVAEVNGETIPVAVKFRARHTGPRELKGLIELCTSKRISRGYVVTKSLDDLGTLTGLPAPTGDAVATQIMRIPAPLLCYWMGATEIAPGDE